MSEVRFYGKGLPGIQEDHFNGTLIVIEGADGSGRSTQVILLQEWLERLGYPTVQVGLKRSQLVGEELEKAMQGNQLCPVTLSLFYATDFVDQLEKTIIPALRAGFFVIADRYIFTLMVRDIVRGSDPSWLKAVYGVALVPDIIFYLSASPKVLAERSLQKDGDLDYWESGMDIQRSGDVYECFVRYQSLLQKEFKKVTKEYEFEVVNSNRDPYAIHNDMQKRISRILKPIPGEVRGGSGISPRKSPRRRPGHLKIAS